MSSPCQLEAALAELDFDRVESLLLHSSGRQARLMRHARACSCLAWGRISIAKAENIVFIGPTGVGKTGLASGLLLKALQNGYRGQFLRAQDLFDDMYASLADHSSRKLINRLARLDSTCW